VDIYDQVGEEVHRAARLAPLLPPPNQPPVKFDPPVPRQPPLLLPGTNPGVVILPSVPVDEEVRISDSEVAEEGSSSPEDSTDEEEILADDSKDEKDTSSDDSEEEDRPRLGVPPEMGVGKVPTSTGYALEQNVPNPFNAYTTIAYRVPQAGRVQLVIYDIRGHRVRTLVQETASAGVYSVGWDGTDQGGQSVASGVYIYRLTGAGFALTQRMLLLK